jgi:hypothetical protein
MSKLTIDGFLLCVLACAACNGETTSPGAGTTDPFVGSWACSDQLTVNFTSPPGFPQQTQSQMTKLTITAASGVLTATKETDGGANCKVMFTSSGSSASLNDGQTCATAQGLTITYKSGSATVSGSSLNSTFDFDAAGNIDMNGVPVAATATGTQSSTCSRLSPPSTGGGTTTTGGW